jgi:hypothetical protein
VSVAAASRCGICKGPTDGLPYHVECETERRRVEDELGLPNNVHALRSSNPKGTATPQCEVVPHPSSLVPSFTSSEKDDDDEPKWGSEREVEWLLKRHSEGKIKPDPVDLPPLPPNATGPMKDVAEFFIRVRGLRLYAGNTLPVVFACDWVARNLLMPKVTAWRAIKSLEDAGVLVFAGKLPGRKGKRGTHTYLPGKGKR